MAGYPKRRDEALFDAALVRFPLRARPGWGLAPAVVESFPFRCIVCTGPLAADIAELGAAHHLGCGSDAQNAALAACLYPRPGQPYRAAYVDPDAIPDGPEPDPGLF